MLRRCPPALEEISTDLGDYFTVVTGSGVLTGPGWYRWEWEACPLVDIPLDELVATNSSLCARRILYHFTPGRPARHGTGKWALRQRGRTFMVEGHHRFCGARLRGEHVLTGVRLMRPPR